MSERTSRLETRNIRDGGVRTNIHDNLVTREQARAANSQIHLDRFRPHETAAAHDEIDAALLVGVYMERDLTIDHVLLALANLAHIGSDGGVQCTELCGVLDEMGDPRTPQFVLGCNVPNCAAFWTRWATRALHSSFLDGRQATAGHEPPTQRRSTTATFLPERPRCHASSLPPWPLPRTTISNCSA